MKKWMVLNKFYLIGAAIGAVSGFLYWKYVGCITGTCAITANPVRSTVYFAFMGAFVFGLFKKKKEKADQL